MEEKKKVAILIVNHLKKELKSENFSEESAESMEVAIQCIESAYSLNPFESDKVDVQLEDVIKEGQNAGRKPNNKSEISQDKKEEAEHHKQCGNEYMKNQNNEKAIESYSISITLNPTNPIYYCNRAAAYNAIGKYNDAIEDCQKAIELDSTYCKAYCRLGLAFSYLKDYHKAVSCYKKACELDPQNIGYQRNYQLTLSNLQAMSGQHQQHQQQHQQHQQQQQPQQPQDESNPGSNNFIETATRIMTDPDVSSVLNNILGDVGGPDSSGLDRLMQVGQTIVTRLQTANPSLLDGLRMQFQNAQNEGQPPPQNRFPDDVNQS